MAGKESVYICEDHPLYSEALKSLITDSDQFILVGSTTNGLDAQKQIEVLKPSIVLLDLNIPGADGFEVLKRLKQQKDSPRVVVLTSFNDRDLIARSKRMGASAYVIKQTEGNRLLKIMKDLKSNSFVEEVPNALSNHFAEDSTSSAAALKLTGREKKIVKELTTGATVSELATRMFISENTVKNHKKSIYRKLGVSSHAELILFCNEHGLLD